MLDIIVTHYKEPWEVGKKFFDMLDLQRGVDFSQFQVILVNDGEENELPDKHFENRHYQVKQISIPHGGVSAARNAGLKAAKDEWVMFCDIDDMFSNVYSLKNMMEILPAEKYNMLWAHIIVEDFLTNKNILMISPEDHNFVFIHGKMYRRSFLIDNNIFFDEELKYNEDSAFNAIFNTIADYATVGEIKTLYPPYIWIRRENSLTSSPGTTDAATWGHFSRNLKVCEAYKRRKPVDQIRGMVTRTAYDTYYMLYTKENSDAIKAEIKESFKQFWKKNKQYYGDIDSETLEKIQNVSFKELQDIENPVFVTREMLDNWLKGINS